MAVNEPIRVAGPFVGDGSLVELDFDFETFAVSDVSVVVTDADDVETVLTLNDDYTVALNSGSAGGSVTLLAALATGTTAKVYGDAMPYTRTGNIIANPSGFFPSIVNAALDRVHVGLLQLGAKIGRALLLPTDPSTVAGRFPVVLPDGSFGWSSGTGADDGLRADLAASGGAALVDLNNSYSVQDALTETISLLAEGATGDGTTDDRAAIIAAINKADTEGKRLVWPRRTYRISSPITGLDLDQIDWHCEGATIVLDAGGDALVAFQATIAVGANHRITGSGLHLDCNGRTHLGMRFLQPLADRTATFHAEGLSVTDTEMQVAAGEASGGVVVRGGYKKVTLIEPRASEIKMRTGAGTIGTNGITGILVMSSTLSGCYPLETEIIRPVVDHVYSLDATYQYDMDGIGVFANPATQNVGGLSTLRVIDPTISRCWGRDVKMQVGWSIVSNPRSTISQGPTGGIINAAYDFQTGSGQLIGGDYTIDGVTYTAGLCRFSCIAETSPMSSRWDGGTVTIKGGATVHRVAVHDTMVAERALSSFTNQSVRGTIREFAWLRSNGLDIDTVRCEGQAIEDITEALCRIESGSYGSAPRRGRLYARDVQHLGAGSPSLVKGNIGGLAATVLCSSESCDGFADPPTAISMTAGTQSAGKMLSQIWAEPPAGEEAIGAGSQRLLSKFMEDAEEWTLPAHGFNSGACIALVSLGVNHTTQALVFTGSGINGIAIGSATQVAASADPGTGSLRIWRSGNSLVIKNSSGSSRSCNVLLFG